MLGPAYASLVYLPGIFMIASDYHIDFSLHEFLFRFMLQYHVNRLIGILLAKISADLFLHMIMPHDFT